MEDLETELKTALHPTPKRVGSVGRQELDQLIATAEIFIDTARAEISTKQPQGTWPEHKAEAYEFLRQLVQKATADTNTLISAVDQAITLTGGHGQNEFRRCNPRPQNASDEQISRTWQSIKTLLDSLNGSAIVVRIKDELEKVCRLDGNDEISKYLLRDGEQLITRYLESRKQSLDPYFEACRDTAMSIEPDFINACATTLLARRLEKTWPRIRQNLLNELASLPSLVQKQALSWEKSPFGIQVQSDAGGAVNVRFDSMDAFRAWVRTPKSP